MKTVHNIYLDALTLQRAGLTPRQIVADVLAEGHAKGLISIIEQGGRDERTGRDLFHLTFERTGEVIRFDGQDWHYEKPKG